MLTGGDGYTVFANGTDVLQPGDALLDVSIDYVTANSPVNPAVEGRIVGRKILGRLGHIDRLRRFLHRRPVRRLAEAPVEQLRHLGIAVGRGPAAEYRRDDPLVAALGRGDEVEARRVGIAGLDPVGALIGVEEAPVGGIDLGDPRIGRAAREDVVVLGVVVEEMPPERDHVARRRHVSLPRQAVGVDEGGLGHAKRLGRAVHARREGAFRPFDRLADRGRGIVGRLDGGGADQVAKRDLLARPQPELRGRFGRRVLRDRDLAVERDLATLHRLEGDVERHHLGQGGRIEPGIGILGMQHLARPHVHHQVRIGRGQRRERGQEERQKERRVHANAMDALPRTSKHLPHLLACLYDPVLRRDFSDLRSR